MVLCATLPTAMTWPPLLEQEDVRFTDDLFKFPGTVSATTKSMGSSEDLPIWIVHKMNWNSKGKDGNEHYLIHVLCRIGSVLDDDSLMPGQSVENRVLIHIRYGLEDRISHKNTLSKFRWRRWIFTGWVWGVWTRYWLDGWTPLGFGRCITPYLERLRPLSPEGKLPLFLHYF